MQKEAEKKLKHKCLCIEIQWMWNIKCMIILVIIGATGIVIKALEKHLEAIPGFTTTDSCTRNITHSTESTAVWNLKRERWGSAWFKRSIRGEKACDRRQQQQQQQLQQQQQQQQQHNNNNNNNNWDHPSGQTAQKHEIDKWNERIYHAGVLQNYRNGNRPYGI